MSESGGFFQVFTHDNYELTNDSQLYFFFTQALWWEYYSKPNY